MALPPIPSLSFASSSKADARSTAAFDNSGFVVNFGAGSSVGSAVPQWVVMAAVIGGAWWLLRKR